MTEKEELSKYYTEISILLAQIHTLIKDPFFAEKFKLKLSNLTLNFLNLFAEQDDVLKYQLTVERVFTSIEGLNEIFKEFRYMNLVENQRLLLYAERDLLTLKLLIMKNKKYMNIEKKPTNTQQENLKADTSMVTVKPRENKQLAESKKKILDFIKSYPNKRTKDIIYEFNVLSDRTVKRNLTDLLRAGLVKKRIDNKAVYYYASE